MTISSISQSTAPRSQEPDAPIAPHGGESTNGQVDAFASYTPAQVAPDGAARVTGDSGMAPIDYNSYRSTKGFNSRVRHLVMHYTALDFAGSTKALTGPSVSAHYLVPDPEDPTYKAAGFEGMRVFNLIDEKERAWHAGVSGWRGRTNLNDTSLGIEIVNQASYQDGAFTFPPFNPQQTKAVKDLALNILQRYPDITPTNVVGHSDIAPGRKSDPGPMFPWRDFYQAGVGAWYDEDVKARYVAQYTDAPLSQEEALKQFRKYGYDASGAGNPEGFKNLVRAFQLHFRPQNYDGVLDVETAAILSALVEKYSK
jgi:N-acetylmuramoyl-L-alanine amidase